jgi:hypothetical protein
VHIRSVYRSLLLGFALLGAAALIPSTASAAAVTWAASPVDAGTPLKAISCPSLTLCVIGDASGSVWTSTNPASGAAATWHRASIDPGQSLTGVSCPTTESWCMAADGSGNVFASNNPAGGAGAWTKTVTLTGVSPDSLSCDGRPAPDQTRIICVAVDAAGNIASDNGSPFAGASAPGSPGWRWGPGLTGPPHLNAVACTTQWLCVAPDGSGKLFSSSNPEQGPLQWFGSASPNSPANVSPGTSLNAAWCSLVPGSGFSQSMCVAVGDSGAIFASSNPTGPPSAWSDVHSGGASLTGVACRLGFLCAAVDVNGNALTSDGTAGTWSGPRAIAGARLNAISCSPGLLCVAIDGSGVAHVGTPPSNLLPTDLSPPSISGTAAVGRQLTENHGTWTNDPDANSFRYQWQRCDKFGNSCAAIPGASSQTYTVRTSDGGHTIRVRETAVNAAGASAPATSRQTGLVTSSPANISLPGISGQPIVGRKLRGSPGLWSGDLPMSFHYQWQKCKRSCTNIAGATRSTYTLRRRDRGESIRLLVSAVNDRGQGAKSSHSVGAVVTIEQLRALILKAIVPRGRAGGIGAILAHGYLIRLKLPVSGKLSFSWRFQRTAVAVGRLKLSANSARRVRLFVSKAGAGLLRASPNVNLLAGFLLRLDGGGGPITGRKGFR